MLYAQAPVIDWQRVLGGSGNEVAYCVALTSDGGYITAGYTTSNDGDASGLHGNGEDVWVIKFSNTGTLEWQKCLGGNGSEVAMVIQQTKDGGYILGGITLNSNDGDVNGSRNGTNAWVVKLSSTGNIEWQRCYGSGSGEELATIQQTKDGGYILVGSATANGYDVSGFHGGAGGDIWVVKINSSGAIEWQKCYGGTNPDRGKYIQQTADGGYIVTGSTNSADGDVKNYHAGMDYWVLKISANGTLEWSKCYGGSGDEKPDKIIQTTDQGYILCGYTYLSSDGDVSGNHGNSDYWILKLDAAGNIQWKKCLGGPGFEGGNASDIIQTVDGGYVFAGSSGADGGQVSGYHGGGYDGWVVKLDAGGNITWENSYGGSSWDDIYSIKEISEGKYVFAGFTGSNDGDVVNNGNGSFWVATLTPRCIPTIVITTSNANICSGTQATFTANVTYGGASPLYQWKRNGINVGTNNNTYTDSFNNNDIVTCTLTSNAACVQPADQTAISNQITVTVSSVTLPTLKIAADKNPVCAGSNVVFTSSVQNAGANPNYQWKLNGNNITGASDAVYNSSTLKNNDTIVCVLTQSNATCYVAVTDTVIMNVNNTVTPFISITADALSVCENTKVTITANAQNTGTAPVYNWKVNGSSIGVSSTVYSTPSLHTGDNVICELTSNALCASPSAVVSNKLSIIIKPILNPSITIAANPALPVCPGTKVDFTATVTNAGNNPVFQWQLNNSSAGSGNTFSSASLNDGDKISCIITADTAGACISPLTAVSNPIVISLKQIIAPSISINGPLSICKDAVASFSAVVQNAGNTPAYQWMVNNTKAGTNTALFNTNSLVNGDSIYCLVTSSNNCATTPVSSNVVSMQVNPLPLIKIDSPDITAYYGKQVQLNAIIEGAVASYTWSPPGELVNAHSLSPVTIPIVNNKLYTLTVESDAGCKAEKSIHISVFSQLYMPSAFTPGGNGLNDEFRIPPSVMLTLKEFKIYDRWGNLVFATTDRNVGWNGKFKLKDAPVGNYIYLLKGISNGREIIKKGNFLLIR